MLGFQPISDEPLSSVSNPAVGAGVTGTLATTNANDTLAAAGSPVIVGTLARTNANDTSAASGSPIIVGTSSTTNADDTLAASGSSGSSVTGTVAYTNNDDTLSASGWAGIVSGTLTTTNADDTLAAIGNAGAGFPFGGTGGGLAQIKPRESEEQKRTRRVAQGIIREAQKPAADVEKLAKKAEKVSAQLKADIAYFEALAEQYAREIEQTRLAMQARNDALATRQLEQRMIQAQLLAEAAAQQREELDVVFMAVMLAALE